MTTLALLAGLTLAGCAVQLSPEMSKAVVNGDFIRVQSILIKQPKLLNAKDEDGWSSLHIAVYKRHKELVEYFLIKGAKVDSREKRFGQTPLYDAAQYGYKDIAELLIKYKANVNAKDKFGWTPLHAAVAEGHKEVAGLLIAKGAKVNAKEDSGKTPLHIAARDDRKEIAELLIANGAKINIKDNSGRTPLHFAALEGREEMVKLLREHGARMDSKIIDAVQQGDFDKLIKVQQASEEVLNR